MQDDTKRFYDLTAEETAQAWYPQNVLMPTIRDFCSLLPDRPRVLDLGCGAGYESKRLASIDARVVGVDYSEESIRIARERTPECRFEVLDFRQLDDRFGDFDGVFACASLIHISPEELPDVLWRIANVLKPGGYLLTIVRDGEGMRETWPVVEGQKLRRLVYRYKRADLEAACSGLVFVRDGVLDRAQLESEQIDPDWGCYIFRSAKPLLEKTTICP
jgi:SAM-dependent methyltransferase